jgi:hypothetical protein
MRFIKRSARACPKVSLILLDWSVRESFHLLHYLSKQNVNRDLFEVIVIEYYSRVSDAIRPFNDQVDTWVLLEMPESCYYHKHLMYNAGIVLSRGEICVICDSDAMVKEGFIETIIGEFENVPSLVLHLDQFRNMRRDFYPFNYPGFDDVIGQGCINNEGGKTKGILDVEDAIHTRNYGACMCARREDLIAIGGADEHIDYLGHICGPYDMTFRLISKGGRELWHQSEFMYHTWHPGQAGVDNYLGPHDGRHVSTTALEALTSRRVIPLLENNAIRALRTGSADSEDLLLGKIIRADSFEQWNRENLQKGESHQLLNDASVRVIKYKGFAIHNELGFFYAHLLVESDSGGQSSERYKIYFDGASVDEVCRKIDHAISPLLNFAMFGGRYFVLIWQIASYVWSKAVKQPFKHYLVRLVETYRRIRRRLQQFSLEKTLLADSISDIILNLSYLKTVRSDFADGGPPILLVDRKHFELYLKLIASVRAIPPLRIHRIASPAQLNEFLSEYGASGENNQIILMRGVYIKYYTIISASEHAKNVAII